VLYAGDEAVLQDDFLRNFHMKPARIMHRVAAGNTVDAAAVWPFIIAANKTLVLINKPYAFTCQNRLRVDAVILSANQKVSIPLLNKAFDCPLYIFDASNPLWKINQWKKECDSLHLRHYSTQESGAFEMEL
jgi:competence protein ComEC